MPVNPEASYYNKFDPAKLYYEVRALAGMVEQSREDNEIQAILKYIVRSLGDTLYKNGSLVSGGALSRSASNSNVMSLQDSKVWYNGIVHPVAAATITLTGSGTETIGILITDSIVTPTDDVDLKDPALGYANYGQPGANRLKTVASWSTSTSAIPVFTFVNGVQQTAPKIAEIDSVTQTLARRTYDESGNYVVSGFDMKAGAQNSDQIAVTVGNFTDTTYSGSKAYVQGQEIVKLVPERLVIDKALDKRLVSAERVFYSPVNPLSPTSTEMRFAFASQPASDVVRVMATFDVIRTVNSHNFNGFDQVTQAGETLVDILAAYKGGTPSAPTTSYTKSTNGASGPGDWYKSGNGLRWDVTGSASEPTAGDTYSAYALVRKQLQTTDYVIYTDSTTGITYLDISAMSTKPYAKNLVTNTTTNSDMDIDYNFYLSRIDVIYVNNQGVLGVTKGSPDVSPIAPYAPGAVLALGQISLPAGGDYTKSTITPYNVKRMTMLDLRKLLTRLERNEYNLAVKDLDSTGLQRAGNSITNLRGILTESFTYSNQDIETDGVNGVSKVKFARSLTTNNMLNVRDKNVQLPELETVMPLSVTSSGTTADIASANAVTQTRATSPIYYPINQSSATGNIAINIYDVAVANPVLDVYPTTSVGRESNQTIIDTLNPTNAAAIVNTFLNDRYTYLLNTQLLSNQQGFTGTTQGSSQTIKTFMPQNWLWVRGSNYTPLTYVDLKFDGRPVRTTLDPSVVGSAFPTGWAAISPAATITGSATGNIYPTSSYVVTNSKGEFAVGVEIPSGVGSGVVSINAEGVDGPGATVQYESNATITFREHTVVDILTPLSDKFKPSLPVLTSVIVKNNANNLTVSDYSSALTFKIAVTWDKAGGVPDSIMLNLQPVTSPNNSFSRVRTSFTQQELDSQTINFVMPVTLNAAFDYVVTASNAGGTSSPVRGTVTYSGNPPITTTSVFTNFGVTNIPYYAGNATFFWEGLTGTVDKLIITSTGNPGTPVVVTAPAASGNATLYLGPGYNTVSVTAVGPLGNSVVRSTTLYVNYYRYDPVAQSFNLDEDAFLDGVDLYFQAKPGSGNTPVSIELRTMDNGIPGKTLVDDGKSVVALSAVNVSSDASASTYFKFPTPVYLQRGQEYCVVVRTDDQAYRLFYAKLGSNLLGTQTPLSSTTASGVMFRSANDSSWSAIQDSDLKFRLNAVSFNTNSVLYFNTVSLSNMVGFHAAFPKVLLPGSGSSTQSPCQITWEYQLDSTGSWYPFEPEAYIYFKNATANLIQVRATLITRSGTKLTPRIPKLGGCLTALTRSTSGSYVTKTATFAQAYRYVRMIVKQNIPAGAGIRWYVSDNTAQPGSVSAWASGTTYASGNIVSYSGVNYMSLQGTNTNHQPDTATTWWEPVYFLGSVVWREIPAVGEIKTLQSDGIFYEHDRTFDLGTNGGRTQFRFRLDLTQASIGQTIATPQAHDVICITTT